MVTIIYWRLDKLRLLKTFNSPHKSHYNKLFARAEALANGGNLNRITEKHRTIYWLKLALPPDDQSLRISFGGSKKGPVVGIEFCPHKIDETGWKLLTQILSKIFNLDEITKDYRVQELEIAMDISHPMSSFVYFDERLGVMNDYYRHQGTIYIGAKYGKRSFTIYDKKKQLQEKKKTLIEKPLTRVEASVRDTKLSLENLTTLNSPFSPLLVIPKHRLSNIAKKHQGDIAVSGLLKAIESGAFGHDYTAQLPPKTRHHLSHVCRPHALTFASKNVTFSEWLAGKAEELCQKLGNSH